MMKTNVHLSKDKKRKKKKSVESSIFLSVFVFPMQTILQ